MFYISKVLLSLNIKIKQIEIMTTQTLNIGTATKSEIIIAATIEKDLMTFLGGVAMIKERSEETLRILLKMYFSLNTEVGAFYDKNGF